MPSSKQPPGSADAAGFRPAGRSDSEVIGRSDNQVVDAEAADTTTKVLLVDERTVVREALAVLIEAQPDLAVAGQVSHPDDAYRLGIEPGVVVADVEVRVRRTTDGVVSQLRRLFPRSGILVLTNVAHPARVEAALADGADGYLLKTATSGDLFTGIRAVKQGDTYLQPSLGVKLARWHGPRHGLRLSPREEQVLVLVAVGHTNGDIAKRLRMSLRTVETHRARMQQKLGRNTRAELFEFARCAGLIEFS